MVLLVGGDVDSPEVINAGTRTNTGLDSFCFIFIGLRSKSAYRRKSASFTHTYKFFLIKK